LNNLYRKNRHVNEMPDLRKNPGKWKSCKSRKQQDKTPLDA